MRTAYLGTTEFAATVLRRLAEARTARRSWSLRLIAARGRGRKCAPPPAAKAARELGLELHQAADVNPLGPVEAIRAVDPPGPWSVCAFGQLIKEPLLSELPMLNVHPSLVPRWRGAAPIERAMMAGERGRE